MKTSAIFCSIFMFIITFSAYGQMREQVSLNKNWNVWSIQSDDEFYEAMKPEFQKVNWFKGDMPRQVQEFIFENGELPNPAVGDNAQKWVSVFEKEWIYSKEFKTPDHNNGDIVLCFDGLDTEVDIYLNNEKLTYCNNMHRRWRIPVAGKLRPAGEINNLVLRFYPPQKVMNEFTSRYPGDEVQPRKYIRKTNSDFTSYMGAKPHFIKMGIFGNVYLDLLPDAYFGDIQVQTFLNDNYSSADVKINSDIRNFANQKIDYEVYDSDNNPIIKGTASSEHFKIKIDYPELWYPMNYGGQPLYSIRVKLRDNSKLLDQADIDFGIRDIQIIQQDLQTGNPLFCIQVNGKQIFMNGACWAPLHGFTHVWNEERADTLLQLMKWGNMNFLRIWGEGSNPGKSLFDFCDQNGIVVMMDFMSSHPLEHPLHDIGFRENITLEIKDVIKRYRNHPCIAFWCGGNEHFLAHKSNLGDNMQSLGRILLQKIMPDAVSELDPQRFFLPSSPWGGDNWFNGNDPLEGDFHDYSTIRFQPLSSVPLFTTEVCMVSPYSVNSMRRFMSKEELWPEGFEFSIDTPGKKAWPQGWENHSIGSAWEKTGRIQDYCDIQDVEDACRVFGLAHGEYLKDRYERQRRGTPDGKPDEYRLSWGAAVWRLNDTWPMIYMSVVDYYLEPKIPYYFLKRACEPVLISFEQTEDKICVWVVNDTPENIADSLVIELVTFDGQVKKRCSRWVNLQPSESERIVDLTHEFYEIQKRKEFLVARFGQQVKSHLLWPEKYLQLKPGEIRAILKNDNLIFESDTYIKSVELSIPGVSGAVFSDNYFDLVPGEMKQVILHESMGGKQIKVKALNSNDEVISFN